MSFCIIFFLQKGFLRNRTISILVVYLCKFILNSFCNFSQTKMRLCRCCSNLEILQCSKLEECRLLFIFSLPLRTLFKYTYAHVKRVLASYNWPFKVQLDNTVASVFSTCETLLGSWSKINIFFVGPTTYASTDMGIGQCMK